MYRKSPINRRYEWLFLSIAGLWLLTGFALLAADEVPGEALPSTKPSGYCIAVIVAPELPLRPGEVRRPRPDLPWITGREASAAQRSSQEAKPGLFHWKVLLPGVTCLDASGQPGFVAAAKDYDELIPDAAQVLTVEVESEDCPSPTAALEEVSEIADVGIADGGIVAPLKIALEGKDLPAPAPVPQKFKCRKRLAEVTPNDVVLSLKASWPGGYSGVEAQEDKEISPKEITPKETKP